MAERFVAVVEFFVLATTVQDRPSLEMFWVYSGVRICFVLNINEHHVTHRRCTGAEIAQSRMKSQEIKEREVLTALFCLYS